MKIAICDVGLGNLRSVERAFSRACEQRRIRAEVEIVTDPDRIRHADKVVMPGQSAFRDCAIALQGGVDEAIREQIARGTPYYGICMGLQLLFETSEESPGSRGLGLFEGEVVRIGGGTDSLSGLPLKIPHMGWNTADPTGGCPLLPAQPTHFYFVHSYAVRPADPTIVAATTEYGERFVSAIAKDLVFATQFHPEKSQRAGLALLERFCAL